MAKVRGNQSSQKLEPGADHDDDDEAEGRLPLLLLLLPTPLPFVVEFCCCCGGGCCVGAPRFQKPTGVVGVDARDAPAAVAADDGVVVPGRPNQHRPPAAGLAPGVALARGAASSSRSAAPATARRVLVGISRSRRRRAGSPPPSSIIAAWDDGTVAGQGRRRCRWGAADASPAGICVCVLERRCGSVGARMGSVIGVWIWVGSSLVDEGDVLQHPVGTWPISIS